MLWEQVRCGQEMNKVLSGGVNTCARTHAGLVKGAGHG